MISWVRAFCVALAQHSDQRRASGEDYILHPLGTATICADLRLDSPTIAAALLHDVVEDTELSIEPVRAEFGDEVALLVDGVTKLTPDVLPQRRGGAGRELPQDDHRDGQRHPGHPDQTGRPPTQHAHPLLSGQGQADPEGQGDPGDLRSAWPTGWASNRSAGSSRTWPSARCTRANTRRSSRWSPNAGRTARTYMEEARTYLKRELEKVKIDAEISGRAKHFYSIYDKMTRKGKEFNEIYDLTALRVLVASVRDCYAALGIIHSLWKPLPGRFKDYIAMPKFNMYQSLHTTVIGPQGKPLEIQIRTHEMHETAEYGIAAHWLYKEKARDGRAKADVEKLQWLRQMMEWQSETKDATEFMESLRIDLFQDEVYVFTPKGAVKSLPAGSTPVDFAYAIHTDVGHRCVGAKVNGRIVPLTYRLQSGDIVEVLTSKTAQGPSRDWLNFVQSSSARNKIRQWFKRERREDSEHMGKEALLELFRKHGLPAQKLMGSDTLAWS